MVTIAPTVYEAVYEVMKIPNGKYVWYPTLCLIDYIPKGKRHATWSKVLNKTQNNEDGALYVAAMHVIIRSGKREKQADKRLKEENSGVTDSWND